MRPTDIPVEEPEEYSRYAGYEFKRAVAEYLYAIAMAQKQQAIDIEEIRYTIDDYVYNRQ